MDFQTVKMYPIDMLPITQLANNLSLFDRGNHFFIENLAKVVGIYKQLICVICESSNQV